MSEYTENHESKESMQDDRTESECWRCDALHEEVNKQNDEIERLKQGICEHVGQDVIGSDCYLCEATIAMKGYPTRVEKAKAFEDRVRELEEAILGWKQNARDNETVTSINKHLESKIREMDEVSYKQAKETMILRDEVVSLESDVKELEEENIRVHKVCNKRAVERDNLRDRVKELETDLKLNAHMLANKCDLHMEGLSKIKALESKLKVADESIKCVRSGGNQFKRNAQSYKKLWEESKDKLKVVSDSYNDLIFQVETKYNNESRHETALRYIREKETGNDISCEAKGDSGKGGE